MEESSLRNDELILNLNESLGISTSSKKIKKVQIHQIKIKIYILHIPPNPQKR